MTEDLKQTEATKNDLLVSKEGRPPGTQGREIRQFLKGG